MVGYGWPPSQAQALWVFCSITYREAFAQSPTASPGRPLPPASHSQPLDLVRWYPPSLPDGKARDPIGTAGLFSSAEGWALWAVGSLPHLPEATGGTC
jgi:hypothetical protein